MSNISTNGAIFSTFKRTDLHTVRGRPTRKDGVVIYERMFRNRSFRELKIAKESHDLGKILPESNQKSNELSMNRKCEQIVTTNERRTFTKVLGADKDKVHRDQTVGNDNKDAMLDCKSGFHPNEDKLKRSNCHIYVTSIMIITFLMFFAQTEYIISCYFSICAIRFVAFCVYWILMLYRNACVVSSNVVSHECDVLHKAALCIQQKCDESALCVQQIDVAKEIKYPEEYRSRYAMFVKNNTSINNREYHVRRRFDREPTGTPSYMGD